MEKDGVKERLNLHLKRKLLPNDSPTSAVLPESVIVTNNNAANNPQYPSQSQSCTPTATSHSCPSQSSKKSPRKAATRNSRRQLNSSNADTINSAPSSAHTTPSVTPVCRSMTATPIGNGMMDTYAMGDGPDAVPMEKPVLDKAEKQPDLLTTVLLEKRLSMFHDPAVVDFLYSIMQSTK